MIMSGLLTLLIPLLGHSESIYNCRLISEASISWASDATVKKPKLTAEGSDSKEKMLAVFVRGNKKATLKIRADQSELKEIAPHTFLQTSSVGVAIMWTLIDRTENHPAYLFKQSAYDVLGPAAWSAGFECE